MKELADRVAHLPVSAALAVDLKAKELARTGRSIINFCVGEPDFATPGPIRAAGIEAIERGDTRYTNAPGMPGLRMAISEHFYGGRYAPEEIAVTTGGKFAVYAAVSALCDPGDEVLLPAPYWTSYYHIVTLAGAVPIIIPAEEKNGWHITPEQLRNAGSERAKVLIFNNPNNPSGAVYTAEELTALAQVLRERDLYCAADEIYDHLVYGETSFCAAADVNADMHARTVSINGVSKSYAMTGWRIGWAAADRRIIKAMSAFLSHTTGCPNTASQYAAVEAVRNGAEESRRVCAVFRRRRDVLCEALTGIDGLRFAKPEGAFYLLLRTDGRWGDGQTFAMRLLEEAGVATVPCDDYGIDNAVRISFSVDEWEIVEGARRIAEFARR